MIHLLAWLVLLGMPLFNTRPDMPVVVSAQYFHYFIAAISFMIVFYVNYCDLISKHLFEHQVIKFLIKNMALIAVVLLVMRFVALNFLPPPDHANPPMLEPSKAARLGFIARNVCLYLLVVGASVAIKMTEKWYTSEKKQKEMEKGMAEAELQNLKSQINPHFLFNTLNNIYSLIQIDSDKAQAAVHDLSRSLRYVMYEGDRPFVPLQSEIEFIDKYIALMKMRLSKRVSVEARMPSSSELEAMNAEVAPLLFITLVENAFKHGVSPDQDSFIVIEISCEEEYVRCHIRNSNHPKTDADRSGSGIGLGNLKKRLELIYHDKYELKSVTEDNVYDSTLRIKLR